MSQSIWTQCAGASKIKPCALTVHRIVESQTVISTRKLVDSDVEQEILETLIDTVKPPLPKGAQFVGLHYLLSTPFRHPPLRHGSRFGTHHERSIWYGSLTIETALAEVAYYRFLFLAGTRARFSLLTTELTGFNAAIRSRRSVDLTEECFARYKKRIRSKISYEDTQLLGKQMRTAGVQAFIFYSARDPQGGKNIGLFEPVFSKKMPFKFSAWVATTTSSRVEFISKDRVKPMRLSFDRKIFEVDGSLPSIGV